MALTVIATLLMAVTGCGQGGCIEEDRPDEERDTGVDDADDASDTETDPEVESTDPPPDCETDADEPLGLVLTWQRDPTSTMTIDWHTTDEEPRDTLCVRRGGEDVWDREVDGRRHDVPHLERDLYRVELTELEADTEYVFQAGDFEREFRFRTMPEEIDEQRLVFASGGDLRDEQGADEGWFAEMNEMVMDFDLDFVVWGGDLAYADGGEVSNHRERWREFFAEKLETLVDDDGRVVPVVVGIGNHEVRKGYYHRYSDYEATDEWREREAPYFHALFAFPGQPGYEALDFGDYLSIIMLDSHHTNPVDGEQTDWLEEVLGDRTERGVEHILPVFHYPAYPSKSPYNQQLPRLLRENWAPLFEEYGVEMAFQHKDHAFLRTSPLRDGEVVDEGEGVVYLGNGNWGATLRDWMTEVDWYADKFVSAHHAYITTLRGDEINVRAFDIDGELLDDFGDEIP